MFFEEWELLTDPQLLTPLPMIYLSGIATLNEDMRMNMIKERKATVEREIKEHYAEIEAERAARKEEVREERGPEERVQELRKNFA